VSGVHGISSCTGNQEFPPDRYGYSLLSYGGLPARARVPHFIYHPAPRRMAGFLPAGGGMSSIQPGEGEIRRRLTAMDLVDCMVALPGQLFGKLKMN
jgi:type I restriction-modification system DNA methylase subunit